MDGMKVLKTFYPSTPFENRCPIPSRSARSKARVVRSCRATAKGTSLPSVGNSAAREFFRIEDAGRRTRGRTLRVRFVEGKFAPRDFLVPDQIIDRTKNRPATFFGNGIVAHVSFSKPFSPTLSQALIDSIKALQLNVHEKGTYLCMEGPAFSTQAESFLHRQLNADVIGMTAIPEAKLAREAEMSYGAARDGDRL